MWFAIRFHFGRMNDRWFSRRAHMHANEHLIHEIKFDRVTKRSRNSIKSVAFDLVPQRASTEPKNKTDSTEEWIYLLFPFWLTKRNANYFVQTVPEGVYSFLIFLVLSFHFVEILKWPFVEERRTSIIFIAVVQNTHTQMQTYMDVPRERHTLSHTHSITLKWFNFSIWFLYVFFSSKFQFQIAITLLIIICTHPVQCVNA